MTQVKMQALNRVMFTGHWRCQEKYKSVYCLVGTHLVCSLFRLQLFHRVSVSWSALSHLNLTPFQSCVVSIISFCSSWSANRLLKLKLKLSKSNSNIQTFRFQTQIQTKLHYIVKLKPKLKLTKNVQTV